MEELACYLPGNLALGVAEGAVVGAKALQYAAIAEELTLTCRRLYSLMPAGAHITHPWPGDSCAWPWTYRPKHCFSMRIVSYLLIARHGNI